MAEDEKTPVNYAEYRQQVRDGASWRARVKREFSSWLAIAADLLAILAVLVIPLLHFNPPWETFFSLLFLGFIATAALIASFIMHRRAVRAERYAYAFPCLHIAIHMLRDQSARPHADLQELKMCLQEVLGAFSAAFSIITGATCRSCIKVINYAPPNVLVPGHEDQIKFSYARTLARDFATIKQVQHFAEDAMANPVAQNTDFAFLFKSIDQRSFFFGNNLPQLAERGQYNNTSMGKHGSPGDKGWTLPYRAAMVWPIRRLTKQHRQADRMFTGDQEIIGYLAVDTPAINVFDEQLDFPIGALLADALFLFFEAIDFARVEAKV